MPEIGDNERRQQCETSEENIRRLLPGILIEYVTDFSRKHENQRIIEISTLNSRLANELAKENKESTSLIRGNIRAQFGSTLSDFDALVNSILQDNPDIDYLADDNQIRIEIEKNRIVLQKLL